MILGCPAGKAPPMRAHFPLKTLYYYLTALNREKPLLSIIERRGKCTGELHKLVRIVSITSSWLLKHDWHKYPLSREELHIQDIASDIGAAKISILRAGAEIKKAVSCGDPGKLVHPRNFQGNSIFIE